MKDIYLDFKEANCKNCYRCLRSCPVKAIEVIDHQARIIDKLCVLCGTCTQVCPQNAKAVHSQKEGIAGLLAGDKPVLASVAPSFISSFGEGFSAMRAALKALGFCGAYETAEGAAAVVAEYGRLLYTGKYKNFITSSCPAVNRLVQQYYPECLPYLAETDTPAIAHAKMLKKRFPNHLVVFIGPCIAKKREGAESGVIDGVLTFEELSDIFLRQGIVLGQTGVSFGAESISDRYGDYDTPNKARFFPIARGIIKSFAEKPDSYEYIAVDGVTKCAQALESLSGLSGMFLELNACEYGCVNGPCSLTTDSGKLAANSTVRQYAGRGISGEQDGILPFPDGINLRCIYPSIKRGERQPEEQEIAHVLHRIGKEKPSDELNCGACGYDTCREKARAVVNGYADIEMCLPFMRERAESMSYEIIKNSPNGIVVLDSELKFIEINDKARDIWGITETALKGKNAVDFMDLAEFMFVQTFGNNITRKKTEVKKTRRHIEITVNMLREQKVIFCICHDITDEVNYEKRLSKVKAETFITTDEVIKKQMRVAQEIASLLGETTAETKVALHKLKRALREENADG